LRAARRGGAHPLRRDSFPDMTPNLSRVSAASTGGEGARKEE